MIRTAAMRQPATVRLTTQVMRFCRSRLNPWLRPFVAHGARVLDARVLGEFFVCRRTDGDQRDTTLIVEVQAPAVRLGQRRGSHAGRGLCKERFAEGRAVRSQLLAREASALAMNVKLHVLLGVAVGCGRDEFELQLSDG